MNTTDPVNVTLFRREHARIGTPVRYYVPGEGLVTGLVTYVSYTRRTVNLSEGRHEDMQYSQRNDNSYRRRGLGPDSPALEYILPEGETGVKGEDLGPFTVTDLERSAYAYAELVRTLEKEVPHLVPEDYEQAKKHLGGLTPREEKYAASLDGRKVRYPIGGEPRVGVVVRSTDSSVWVVFSGGDQSERRFSRRVDGKYRLARKGNVGWPPLEFLDPDIAFQMEKKFWTARLKELQDQEAAKAAELEGMDLI